MPVQIALNARSRKKEPEAYAPALEVTEGAGGGGALFSISVVAAKSYEQPAYRPQPDLDIPVAVAGAFP